METAAIPQDLQGPSIETVHLPTNYSDVMNTWSYNMRSICLYDLQTHYFHIHVLFTLTT
jgi:hypothetical protein